MIAIIDEAERILQEKKHVTIKLNLEVVARSFEADYDQYFLKAKQGNTNAISIIRSSWYLLHRVLVTSLQRNFLTEEQWSVLDEKYREMASPFFVL